MIDVEPDWPLGDPGDMLRYRLRDGELIAIDPKKPFGPLGHSYLAVTCSVRGFDQMQVDRFADLAARFRGGRGSGIALPAGAWLSVSDEAIAPFRPSIIEQVRRQTFDELDQRWRATERELGVPWPDPGMPRIDPLTYRPVRTRAQTRFLIVCGIIAAIWLSLAIAYLLTGGNG